MGAMHMHEIAESEYEDRERDPFKVCLDIWARWSSLADHQVSLGIANEQDTKEFMRAGEAIDVMINSLTRRQWWALHKAKGMCTVWIFAEEKYPEALLQAREALEPRLQKHIATRRYFN